jgi:hypothetical protein
MYQQFLLSIQARMKIAGEIGAGASIDEDSLSPTCVLFVSRGGGADSSGAYDSFFY